MYEHGWHELRNHDRGPEDYEDRSLHTTWNMSLQQVQAQDPAAAELLALMAYLDNQNLRFELFHAGHSLSEAPEWWIEVSKSRPRFKRAMSMLHDYSLLEVRPGGYSLHTCVHDWTLEHLNADTDVERYRIAVYSIAQSVTYSAQADYWAKNQLLLPHARRLLHHRFRATLTGSCIAPGDLSDFVELFKQGDMLEEAQNLCEQALASSEEIFGHDHVDTLETANRLGTIYLERKKLEEAEQMYKRALTARERVLGPDHTRTLETANNLGVLYEEQGKFEDAEQIYTRVLSELEKALGPDHIGTLHTVHNLGLLYTKQRKLEDAERLLTRALPGFEKALGPDHPVTLTSVNNLAYCCRKRGKIDEAEQMHIQALARSEKVFGPDHPQTLTTVNRLGWLYAFQGQLSPGWERRPSRKGYKYFADHNARAAVLKKLRG